MLKIIREGKEKQPSAYEFHCSKCDCIWETDEVRLGTDGRGLVTVSDCPCCGNNGIVAYKLVL